MLHAAKRDCNVAHAFECLHNMQLHTLNSCFQLLKRLCRVCNSVSGSMPAAWVSCSFTSRMKDRSSSNKPLLRVNSSCRLQQYNRSVPLRAKVQFLAISDCSSRLNSCILVVCDTAAQAEACMHRCFGVCASNIVSCKCSLSCCTHCKSCKCKSDKGLGTLRG